MDRDEDEIYALLRHLDHPPPRVTATMIAARVRRGGFDGRRWAAGILLASTLAGAAYAAPGSPVRGWISAAVERVAGRDEPPRAPLAPAEEPPGSQSSASGIAVAPGRELLILFTSPQPAGQARVTLTDASEVIVRASSGGASFTSEIDRLVIDNRGSSSDFEIQIPRAAGRVEIRVAGDRIFLKSGPRITSGASMPSPGSYLLPLTRLEP